MRKAGCEVKLIVCIDNKNGIAFNGRRQSQDRAICEDILNMTGTGRLYVSRYSFGLFEKYRDSRVIQSLAPGRSAGSGDFCFAEDMEPESMLSEADMLIVYCWNKLYPADRYFDADISGFHITAETEFKGNSHEKITKRVYMR